MQQALIIFSKNPVKGQVKTRLASKIGHDAAHKVYRELISITAGQCSKITDAVDLHVFYSDHIGKDDEWTGIPCTSHIQAQSPDLGIRMKEAFRQILDSGYARVVIIGTDCPYLDHTTIISAFNALDSNELVVGPALDGGFYLLGTKDVQHLIFNNIEWSTSTVYDILMANTALANIRTHSLQILEDIDEIESFNRFKKSYKHLNCNNL